MKIDIIGTRGIPAKFGGFETCAEESSIRLASKNHNVTVYCRKFNSNFRNFKGVKLIDVTTLKLKGFDTLIYGFLSSLKSILNKPDIVHIYNLGNAANLILFKIFNIPSVVSVDAKEWERLNWSFVGKLWFKICRKLIKNFSNAVICDSLSILSYYENKLQLKPYYIPYGSIQSQNEVIPIDTDSVLNKYNLKQKQYIVTVGRLVPEKKFEVLINAFLKIKSKKVKLVIIGDEIPETKYSRKLKQNTFNNVIFTGFLYGQECNTIWKNALLYVQPSEIEGTSISMLTSMGYGLCTIANNTPENKEVINNDNLLFNHNDYNSLYSILNNLLQNTDLCSRHGIEAKKRAKKFYNWKDVTNELELLYSRILSI